MAICIWCDQDMRQAAGCTRDVVRYPDGLTLPALPWAGPGPCPDCHVTPGHYHHPLCDAQRCPRCGGLLIACPCLGPFAPPPISREMPHG